MSHLWFLRPTAWNRAVEQCWGSPLAKVSCKLNNLLIFPTSFYESYADAAGMQGHFFQMGASSGRSLWSAHPQRTTDLNHYWFAGYCFPKLFKFMCSSPSPSGGTDAGGGLCHGGGDIVRAVVGTSSWEKFLSSKSPHQGCARSPVPSIGVFSPPLLLDGKSVVWPCSK